MTHKRINIIGVGGGWLLVLEIAFFLSYHLRDALLSVVDGGNYQSSQLDHEHFLRPGNKAIVQAEMVHEQFPSLNVRAVPRFVAAETGPDTERFGDVIKDGGDRLRTIAYLLATDMTLRRTRDRTAEASQRHPIATGLKNVAATELRTLENDRTSTPSR